MFQHDPVVHDLILKIKQHKVPKVKIKTFKKIVMTNLRKFRAVLELPNCQLHFRIHWELRLREYVE